MTVLSRQYYSLHKLNWNLLASGVFWEGTKRPAGVQRGCRDPKENHLLALWGGDSSGTKHSPDLETGGTAFFPLEGNHAGCCDSCFLRKGAQLARYVSNLPTKKQNLQNEEQKRETGGKQQREGRAFTSMCRKVSLQAGSCSASSPHCPFGMKGSSSSGSGLGPGSLRHRIIR